MTGSLFGRLMRSLQGNAGWLLGLGIGLLALGLTLGAMSALAWDSPPQLNNAQLLLLLDNELLNDQIDDLYLTLREWPEIRTPTFALDVRDLDLPPTIAVPSTPGFTLNLLDSAAATEVIARAELLNGVLQVLTVDDGSVTSVLLETQTLRSLLLSAFVVLVLASLMAFSGVVVRLLKRWRGELELLRLTGIPRKQVASSFAIVGVLGGGVGALIGAFVIYLAYLWGKANPSLLYQYLPGALSDERMIGLAVGAIVLGLLIGVLAGAWGIRSKNFS